MLTCGVAWSVAVATRLGTRFWADRLQASQFCVSSPSACRS
jgi:hypothetical protein